MVTVACSNLSLTKSLGLSTLRRLSSAGWQLRLASGKEICSPAIRTGLCCCIFSAIQPFSDDNLDLKTEKKKVGGGLMREENLRLARGDAETPKGVHLGADQA